jgi:hypothetical protein
MIRTKRLPLYVAGGAGLSALAVLGLTLSQSGSSAAGVSASPSSTVVQTRASSLGQSAATELRRAPAVLLRRRQQGRTDPRPGA